MDTCARIKRVCVFCGARDGTDPAYTEAATHLGALLARAKLGLVYGGGSVGLMGAVADAALAAGGEVVGVIPRSLAQQEMAHPHVTKLHVVDSMHVRKAMMAELADAFIVLPGGFGTMDELFEIVTWRFLGLHRKPVALINTRNFFAPLIKLLDHFVTRGFAEASQREMASVCSSPKEALQAVLASHFSRSDVSARVEQSASQ